MAVAKEDAPARGALAADRADHRRVADDRALLERPVDAAGPGVERVDVAVVAARKHAARYDRRLRVVRHPLGEAERPLQLQLRHVRGGQARRCGGLEPGVREIVAPSVPRWTAGWIAERRIRCALVGHRLRFAGVHSPHRAASHELADALLLNVVEILPLRMLARRERGVDALGRHLPDRKRGGRCVGGRVAVAAEALPLESSPSTFRPWRGAAASSRRRRRRGLTTGCGSTLGSCGGLRTKEGRCEKEGCSRKAVDER